MTNLIWDYHITIEIEDTEVVRHLGSEVVRHQGSEIVRHLGSEVVRHCFGGSEVVRHWGLKLLDTFY